MKKRSSILLFIMFYVISILITYNMSKETFGRKSVQETEKNTETEEDTELTQKLIDPSVAVNFSDREISLYCKTSCFVNMMVSVNDNNCSSVNNYGPFEIKEGVTSFTLDDLSSDFFSGDAKIKDVSYVECFVYGDSPLENSYQEVSGLQFKCYDDKIVFQSTTDCFVDFTIATSDQNKAGHFYAKKVPIKKGNENPFKLKDLIPEFYSDEAKITSYSPLTITAYKE